MKIFHNLDEWIKHRGSLSAELSLGFVPTMGNLHRGHASLLAQSKKENDLTIASLFINPIQFNQLEDFTNYPRTLEADLELLENQHVDYCLLPTQEAMYPLGHHYRVEENKFSLLMEGKARPGHFNGVLTVVMKLLNLVNPTQAYFGEKDFQQYLLIQGMIDAFFMKVTIKLGPTIRETSGLAYSSRNNRLNAQERLLAEKFASIFHQPKPCESIIQDLQETGITVEYVVDHDGRRFAAVVIGKIRLIDNYELINPNEP